MRRQLSILVLALAMLTACSSSGGNSSGGSGGSGGSGNGGNGGNPTSGSGDVAPPTGAAAGADDACSQGVKANDPGVVDVYCSGTAEVKIQVGDISKDLRGGTCQGVAGQVWSVSVGVIVDVTGMHGTYAGPQVDNIEAVTNGANGATVQGTLDGKLILSNSDAAITLSADNKTAHIDGTGERNSDTPDAKITVDVTC